jgi:hypothetical protein
MDSSQSAHSFAHKVRRERDVWSTLGLRDYLSPWTLARERKREGGSEAGGER